jgi:RNase P subunit RPR2
MKTALLKASDKKEITANDAAVRNEKRAFCPNCRQPVRLHVKLKRDGQPTHFEHLNHTGKCRLETRYRSDSQS